LGKGIEKDSPEPDKNMGEVFKEFASMMAQVLESFRK
jgi:hypothetical protein